MSLRRALLIVATTCLSFLLLEVSMIVLDPYLFRGPFRYDPDIGFRERASVVHNRFGFNSEDFPLEKTPGVYRILIIGDSYNWAGGRKGNYTAFIDRKFQEHYGCHRVDIINAGYPATHTGHELAILKKFGVLYHPDLVFLGFFAGNDFYDADPDKVQIAVNDTILTINRRELFTFLGYPLFPRSRVFSFLQQKYEVFREMLRARRENNLNRNAESGLFSEKTFMYEEKRRLQFCNLGLHASGKWQKNIDYIFESFIGIRKLLEDRKIKFMVGIYPDEFQVNDALLKEIFREYHYKAADYDVEIMQKLLKGFLASQGIPCLDLLPEFRAKNKSVRLYAVRDPHWNEAGNRLAADLIFPHLLNYVEAANGPSSLPASPQSGPKP